LFTAVADETPKDFTLRLRVCRGAALLLTTEDSVLDIALACGFQSHEAFTRAFGRQFGVTPRAYRARGFAGGSKQADGAAHLEAVTRIAPCVRLFHMPLDGAHRRTAMSYSVVEKILPPQPVLVVRRRVARSDIAKTIGETLPLIFQYAQERGIALAGHPFTRYIEFTAGFVTLEPGMRIAGRSENGADASVTPVKTDVLEDTLPDGPTATVMHVGPYDTLSDAYAAIELWMQANRRAAKGAPWEFYVTDPAEHPDPRDWRTEVFWPLETAR
jgi:AraC family transcriptional regulator